MDSFEPRNYDYDDVPTIRRFSLCDKEVRLLMGPFGSGKSSGCIMEGVLVRGMAQKPDSRGVRRTKFLCIRNTYGELEDTTMATFFEWFPRGECGEYKDKNHTFRITNLDPGDGTTMDMEVLFRALDRPQDVDKLGSLNVTFAWLNELREIPKEIFTTVRGRCGRFPPMWMGGPTWKGVFADTNAPDDEHWIYELFEKQIYTDPDLRANFEIFKQPSGMSPDAENLRWLLGGRAYYRNLCIGTDEEFQKVYVHGLYGRTKHGKPVYPNYRDDQHFCAGDPLSAIHGIPLILGFDFGNTPAAVLAQAPNTGELVILQEWVTTDCNLHDLLVNAISPVLLNHYTGFPLVVVGDISKKSEIDGRTTYGEIRSVLKVDPIPPPTNTVSPRQMAVNLWLTKMVTGKPAFRLSSACPVLRGGFNGKFCWRRLHIIGSERYADEFDKNQYSHPHEALQYICMYLNRDPVHERETANRIKQQSIGLKAFSGYL